MLKNNHIVSKRFMFNFWHFFAFCDFDPIRREIRLVKRGWKFFKSSFSTLFPAPMNASAIGLMTLYWSKSRNSKKVRISQKGDLHAQLKRVNPLNSSRLRQAKTYVILLAYALRIENYSLVTDRFNPLKSALKE